MGDTKNEILDAVKLLLGIKDNDKDDVLMLLIEDTVNSVLAYCRIDVLPRQITRCTIFVVSMEFITGIIVNKWYHLAVWDYSDMPLQLCGQICLPFALIFSFLCTIGIILSGYLLHWFYREPLPHYRIW